MKPLLTCVALCLTTPALAGEYCLIDGTEMFTCTFKNGDKAVQVCDAIWEDDFRATYGFYRPGQEPELELSNDMTEMHVTPWNGTGTPWGAVKFHSADHAYGYEVWYSGDEGGITVTQADKEIAKLDCDPGSLTHDLDLLIAKIEASQVSP